MDQCAIKIDDLLLKLLNDYHSIDASEAASFFTSRISEMLECEPNITEKNKRNFVDFKLGKTNSTALEGNKQFVKDNKVYVLRGFYPKTHIPFKMTVVNFAPVFTSTSFISAKIIIGLKEHYTSINLNEVKKYEDAISEAILLSKEVENSAKINYSYRKFKCMRPKGIELYVDRTNRSN